MAGCRTFFRSTLSQWKIRVTGVSNRGKSAMMIPARVGFLIPGGMLGVLALLGCVRQTHAQEPGTVFRDCDACPEMVVVPPGDFMMGSSRAARGWYTDEGPRHEATIGYSLGVGVYEVTFAEWDACVSAGGCMGHRPDDGGLGRERQPVINVSWEDARTYLRWLSEETGESYRLLSEAEWEYVARAGTESAWYWGEDSSDQCRHANGFDRELTQQLEAEDVRIRVRPASCSDGYEGAAPVGSFEPNGFGLHDVSGNVWEWTDDCWNESYAGAPADGRAWTDGYCVPRVVRGGSWNNPPGLLRSAFRDGIPREDRGFNIGFRVARTMN